MTMSDGLYQREGYAFMAAAFAVYNELGSGFLEEVYHESLELELTLQGMSYLSKTTLPLSYKGTALNKHYQADLIVAGEIIVELKAVRALTTEHDAQLINYLRATGKRVGYLVYYGAFPRLQWKRLVL